MEELRIVDMASDNRGILRYKPGEHWRSTCAYKCPTCGCISNNFWHPKYCPPLLICPGDKAKEDLHFLLDQKILNLEEGHPASYVKEISLEIEEIRMQFRDVIPDVEMIGDSWKLEKVLSVWGEA